MPHQHNSILKTKQKKNKQNQPLNLNLQKTPAFSWLFFRFPPEDILPFATYFMARTTYIKAPELSPLRRYQAPPQHSFRGIRRWRNRPSHGDVEGTRSWRSWGNPNEILGSVWFFLLKDRNFEYVSWNCLMLFFWRIFFLNRFFLEMKDPADVSWNCLILFVLAAEGKIVWSSLFGKNRSFLEMAKTKIDSTNWLIGWSFWSFLVCTTNFS